MKDGKNICRKILIYVLNILFVVCAVSVYENLFETDERSVEGFMLFFPNRILYLCFCFQLSALLLRNSLFDRNHFSIHLMLRYPSRFAYLNAGMRRAALEIAGYVCALLGFSFLTGVLRGYPIREMGNLAAVVLPFYLTLWMYLFFMSILFDCLCLWICDQRIAVVATLVVPLFEAGIFKRQLFLIFQWLPAGSVMLYDRADNPLALGRLFYLLSAILLLLILRDRIAGKVDVQYVDEK